MIWNKKGLIYSPPRDKSWRDNSALTPTPLQIDKKTIRVFCGFRDEKGISRIGYVDLSAENPSKIMNVSDKPVLDIGNPGNFDDNGVILGDVIRKDEEVWMYYVGFQLVKNVKFLAYSGLAISKDNGTSFQRVQQTPILERAEEGTFIRAIHSVLYEENKFKVWYSVGSSWEQIDGKDYPNYDINYIESEDGIHFNSAGVKCIINDQANKEYRIGRPRAFKRNGTYYMHYTYGTLDGKYEFGLAESVDGIQWQRKDHERGIELSEKGWDSIHLCYPALLNVHDKIYMFYNGNNMGIDGFGYAELNT
jgi:predicted GH43/DUF377 family glycosyl hydrolase